ncbi:MAG: thioredoxin domain-containing protein [Novosphingobium sp.]|uniref:thioredoxin domain-containing protein n=1 Tax=Novosphingobium sp. TaxID=1874826 RepID=UPI00180B0F53|nr:thioredoxin domain-containing protein [Novosphingobium sp.]
MTGFALRRIALVAALAPLALGLAACNKEDAAGPALSGAPLAAIAPPAGKSWAETIAVTPEGGYLMGNPQAPIKLVEYGSLTCSHCAEFAHAATAELRDSFVASGRVSFEFRNFIRDAIDLTAAQLTHCGPPESFFALTDQVFANQMTFMEKAQTAGKPAQDAAFSLEPAKRGPAIGELTGLTEFFASRGIAKDQANACLADAAKAEAMAAQVTKQADQYQITGTPTFLINGKKADFGAWPELKVELERLGAR